MSQSNSSSPQGRPVPSAPAGPRGIWIKTLLWRLSIFAIALLVAIFVGVPILPYALELPASVVFPLALIIATLFAAISASWVGTSLAPDHTRTRLLPVVGISIGTAALIALLEALTALTERVLTMLATDVGEIKPFMVPVIVVALSASWATWHFRSPRDRVGWEAKLTLALAFAVFFVTLLPDFLLGFSALLGILPDNVLNFTLSRMLSRFYVLGMSVAEWLSIASVALGLALAMWRFRRRRDLLSIDAAITLCLVALAPLIISGVYMLYTHGFFNGLY